MILALGDCNIVGANAYRGETYADLVAKRIGMELVNRGITMSTTKEGRIIFDEERHKPYDLVMVAYGLVDSWRTFKYAPYVLYYPDNFWRKLARKGVKKYKKIARKLGLNDLLGQKYVVAPQEYETNVEYLVQNAKRAILIETPPHLVETFRNPDIQKYNAILHQIAHRHSNASVIAIYDLFAQHKEFYLDEIHMNQQGYEAVAESILERL